MKLLPRRLFLGLLCALPAGCAMMDSEPPIDLMLVNIQPGQGGGIGDAAMDFIIRLENTSPEALIVDGGKYKIYLNGTYIGQGLSNERIDLPRLATATVKITVHLSTFRLAGSLYSIFKSHQVTYRLDGTVYAARPGGSSRKFKASREGTVNLDEVQQTLAK